LRNYEKLKSFQIPEQGSDESFPATLPLVGMLPDQPSNQILLLAQRFELLGRECFMALADNINDPIHKIAHFDEVAFWFLTSSSLLASLG
jgi:hypothetical protein